MLRTSTRIAALLLAVAVPAGCSSTSAADTAAPASPKPSPSAAAPLRATTYEFPVRSAEVGFGKVHHDYPATDIFAPCGSAALAAADGVVSEVSRKDDWTVAENDGATRGGLSVSIVGVDGVRYYGSHLKSVGTSIVPGHKVKAGDVLGRVGKTGSARPTSCHLHFGISPPPCAEDDWWNRRGVLAPYPFLTSWQKKGRRSPVTAVAAWTKKHGCPEKPSKSSAE